MEEKKGIGLNQILFVQGAVIVYSFCGVFQKFAAGCKTLSLPFLLYYACSIGVLFIYALLWQIILKKVPLTTAYGNRAVAMIWSVIWGVAIFGENVSWNKIVGALVICVGVYLVSTGGAEETEEKEAPADE